MRKFPLIDQHRWNCVPKALAIVCEGLRTEAEVLETCFKHGFNKRHGTRISCGMYTYDWLNAATELGLELERVDTSCAQGSATYSAWGMRLERYEMTLGEFTRKFNTGVYLICVPGHALVVNNGVIVDPNYGRNHARRHVKFARLVKNSVLKPVAPARITGNPLIRFVRHEFQAHPTPRSTSTLTGIALRYREAVTYAKLGQPVRLRDVLANSTYRRCDFRYDLTHGNIELVTEEVQS